MSDKEKLAALDRTISSIEKRFGRGSIMRLGDASAALDIPVISTGSLSLDLALGIGGLPRGRVIEIFGSEGSGKTTVALHAIAEVQRQGGIAVFIDAEHSLNPRYAQALGVDADNLLISQPDTGEQALEIADTLVRSGAVDIIVIDSVAALVPQAELEGDMGDVHVGLQARLMSQALRKLTGSVSKTNTCLVFINQLREKVGVLWGNPETTPGGRALKFYASVRIEVRRSETLRHGNEIVGIRVHAKVVKNKLSPPFREATFDLLYGRGISRVGEVLDMAVSLQIIEKSGSWYFFNGERLGQGRDSARAFLEQNPDLLAQIESRIKDQLKNWRP